MHLGRNPFFRWAKMPDGNPLVMMSPCLQEMMPNKFLTFL
jgi:hypothetical protein